MIAEIDASSEGRTIRDLLLSATGAVHDTHPEWNTPLVRNEISVAEMGKMTIALERILAFGKAQDWAGFASMTKPTTPYVGIGSTLWIGQKEIREGLVNRSSLAVHGIYPIRSIARRGNRVELDCDNVWTTKAGHRFIVQNRTEFIFDVSGDEALLAYCADIGDYSRFQHELLQFYVLDAIGGGTAWEDFLEASTEQCTTELSAFIRRTTEHITKYSVSGGYDAFINDFRKH